MPDVANGERLYTTHCLTCHGTKGTGDGVTATAMMVKPDNMYDELVNPFGLKAELINSVLEGDNGQGGIMPAFKPVLTATDINHIFGYITHINEN